MSPMKALSDTIEAMKTNPSCLAAIILAGMFAFLTYIGMQRESERSQARVLKLGELLERCLDDKAASGKSERLGYKIGANEHWYSQILTDSLHSGAEQRGFQ